VEWPHIATLLSTSLFFHNKQKYKSLLELETLHDLFHLPLSMEAYDHFCEVEIILQTIRQSDSKDRWSYIWGSENYSSAKAYKHLLGFQMTRPAFRWLWGTSCQQKHSLLLGWVVLFSSKVFFQVKYQCFRK
jgi:hypothetical protein